MIKNALIKTTTATAIDCTHIEKINNISIDTSEPTGTQTRYLLSVDGGKWQKYSEGDWNFAIEQDLTAESVLSEGNTKAELISLTENDLTMFSGKIIDVAVAISVENNAEVPTLGNIEFNGTNLQTKKNIIFSDIYKLGTDAVGITGIDVVKNELSGGAVNIYASVLNDSGEWSDYVEYSKLANKGKAIRFKAEVESDKPGISTAILNSVQIHHWQDSKSAAVEGKSVLITKPYTLDGKFKRAHAIIRHPNIKDTEFAMSINLGMSSEYKAMTNIATYERNGEVEEEFEFIAPTDTQVTTVSVKIDFVQNSGTVTEEKLGEGTGRQQIFKLPHHAKAETIQVTGADEWIFKEKTDTLLVTASNGSEIFVSYDWIGQTNCLTAFACTLNS